MARIPEAEIQRLKQEIALERLCERYGIALTRQGKNLVGRCPWHDDDTPSFVVTPATNLWHCMGACDTGGDVFSLVMKAEGVSFRHAAEKLRELRGDDPAGDGAAEGGRTPERPPLVNPADLPPDPELLGQVVEYYHQTFQRESQARQYLARRHCLHSQAVERFRIGYANRTLGYRLPAKQTVAAKAAKQALQRVGIVRDSGHEHLNGSVVFPITDLTGKVVQLYGRKILDRLRKGTPKHLYLPGPLRGVWNLNGLVRQHTWVLCEAVIDALTLWCHGIGHVTCCFGKNTFTEELWTLVRQAQPDRVLIAFDRDAAGNLAAEHLAPQLAAEGVTVHRVQLPEGHDINGYVCGLAEVAPASIPRTLDGLLADAPIIARPGSVSVPVPAAAPEAPRVDRARPSSLAAKELAAKKNMGSPKSPDSRAESPTISTEMPDGPHHPDAPIPAQPAQTQPGDVETTIHGDEVELRIGPRVYRARGLAKNRSLDALKVNLRVMSPQGFHPSAGSGYHIDTLDLYNARHRSAFVNLAAKELGVGPQALKADMGRVLLRLEDILDAHSGPEADAQPDPAAMSEAERRDALALLQAPDLLDRILRDFDTSGLVGERTNKLVGYLAAVSRKLEKPLAVVIQSSSASGKTTLMEAILAMMPEEERIQYSAMTGQSLFYLGEQDLKHKILAIVEEEGARHASYALKLLQSEGQLTIASTGKDAVSGQLVTKEYHVEGPVMLLTTSTAIDIDEELLNRCLVLTVDESRAQTRAIHARQRRAETLDGLQERLTRQDTLVTQRHAQRLLRPLHVVNPYATELTFLDDQTRTRRDHQKYLMLIRALALLHQHQRPVKTFRHQGEPVAYIEVTLDDIATANQLANEVLGRSLDELPPQTRRFLDLLFEMVQERAGAQDIDPHDIRFTQRQIRQLTGWSDNQVKTHLRKLVSLEYVLVHRSGRGQRYVYELLYQGEGRDGRPFLMGLLDTEKLLDVEALRQKDYDENRVHKKPNRVHKKAGQVPPGCPQDAPRVAQGCMPKNSLNAPDHGQSQPSRARMAENAKGGLSHNAASYHSSNRTVREV